MKDNMKGITKLIILAEIKLYKLELKFVAINKDNGGPNTIQQKKAIKQSAATSTKIFLFLDKFLRAIENLFIKVILL